MIDIDPKSVDSAKEILRLGQATEFWKLICDALDDSIVHLQKKQDDDDIEDLPAERYKVETELLKAKRKYLAHLKRLPEALIAYLTQPAGNLEKDHNFDPFYTAEELGKELSKSK